MADSKHQISTLSGIAQMVARTLEAQGIDPAPLFRQAGIELKNATDPEGRLPAVAMQKVWHMATQVSLDPCFGLSVAQNIQPGALHGLGFAWISSDTLLDGLNRLARYFRVLVSTGEVILENDGRHTQLWLKVPPHGGRVAWASLDAALALFVQMCRLTAGPLVVPTRVQLQRPKPDCAARLEAFFGADVAYDQPENTLLFDNELLNKPLATANPALARITDQVVIDYLARFDQASLANQVLATIIELLPSGNASQERVAEAIHMSVRNLQRKLKLENTSFKKLLTEARQQLAKQYLAEPHRGIGEVSYLLGFTEPGNFTRAFKRWTGESPQTYRESRVAD